MAEIAYLEQSGAGQEGNRSVAISPTGSRHRGRAVRVTNDRVAASRARLTYGYETPGFLRPQTPPALLHFTAQKQSGNHGATVHGQSRAAHGAEVNLTSFIFPRRGNPLGVLLGTTARLMPPLGMVICDHHGTPVKIPFGIRLESSAVPTGCRKTLPLCARICNSIVSISKLQQQQGSLHSWI
jgi:hypothetical protein